MPDRGKGMEENILGPRSETQRPEKAWLYKEVLEVSTSEGIRGVKVKNYLNV